ncbi:hypothetical protein BDN72DRAFT_536556 [Pluteus cervinus]|uniref:Uncharacterized protein n=1 Tax=Pluteus cervinus TaxID=181527 RepID=A0ACD3A3K5_9AGAR|nr:hypothetical protein BDN72DRAFT_536556 [Pluteus cervinus]
MTSNGQKSRFRGINILSALCFVQCRHEAFITANPCRTTSVKHDASSPNMHGISDVYAVNYGAKRWNACLGRCQLDDRRWVTRCAGEGSALLSKKSREWKEDRTSTRTAARTVDRQKKSGADWTPGLPAGTWRVLAELVWSSLRVRPAGV